MDYKKEIIGDYPQASELITAGLITDKAAQIYCIRKKFREIAPNCESRSQAIYRLAHEFKKSEESVYNYVRSIVI